MARQSRGQLRLGRMFSPRSRSAVAVASAEAQAKRHKQRAQKWRARFKRLSLSVWHQNAIVATVCGLFRSSADAARVVRAATVSQVVGVGYRRALRMEPLEARQMLALTVTPNVLGNWQLTASDGSVNAPAPSIQFESGPAAPPIGTGSAELRVMQVAMTMPNCEFRRLQERS